jgi:hypothetical protein
MRILLATLPVLVPALLTVAASLTPARASPQVETKCRVISWGSSGHRLCSTGSSSGTITADTVARAIALVVTALGKHRTSSLLAQTLPPDLLTAARAGIVLSHRITSGINNQLTTDVSVSYDSTQSGDDLAVRSCLRIERAAEQLWAVRDPADVLSDGVRIPHAEKRSWQRRGWAIQRIVHRHVKLDIILHPAAARPPSKAPAALRRQRTITRSLAFAILVASFDIELALRREVKMPRQFKDRWMFAEGMLD